MGEMTRRKREIVGLRNERDFPHLVELALQPGSFRSVFLEIDTFHRDRMTKAELRAQGIQALAQVTTPIIKLPIKIRRQCGRCGDFNSVLVQPGQAVPAFRCSACGYRAG